MREEHSQNIVGTEGADRECRADCGIHTSRDPQDPAAESGVRSLVV
jgi:hypothetical protein